MTRSLVHAMMGSTACYPLEVAMMSMPLNVKIAVGAIVTALVGGAVYLIALRGPAMMLDMAASAFAFICL